MSFAVMSTIVASIAPKLFEVKTTWYATLYWECRAGTQITFPKSGRGLRHVQFNGERDAWQTFVFVGCTGADRQTLGDE